MMDSRYVGLALAMSGNIAIGLSFIITKKGLNDAARQGTANKASEDLRYLRNPIWWAGMCIMVTGELANFAAYAFAPPALVTPLGSISVLVGAILASFMLGETLGHIGRVGCTLALAGSLIIVLHAPAEKEIATVDEILDFAVQPGFLMFCFTVLVFTLFMIYGVAPKHGDRNPLVYVCICSLAGSVSVMAIKGFGVAVKLTLAGNNQLMHPSTYAFAIVMTVCILVQMNYLNKALDTFSTNVVNPMYFVGFSTGTLIASLILFQGFDNSGARDTLSLLSGFAVTFLGVHLLNISRQPEPPLPESHSGALERGLLMPRLSLQGRMSIDGWNGAAMPLTPHSGNGHARGNSHGRRSSLYRAQSATLFNTFEHDDDELPASEHLGRVDEDPDREREDEEADERTRLRGEAAWGARGSHSRSGSRSPRIGNGNGDGARRSPQYR